MELVPKTQDLVLIGGGHAHALILKKWGMNPLPGVRLTLINPDPVVPYTGMLPGYIAGHYTREEMMIDLVRLARHADARLVLASASGIDRVRKRIVLSGHDQIAYDLASIDIGITSNLDDVPGSSAFAVSAKPLGQFAERWEAFVALGRKDPRIVIVGAGIGGAELALSTAYRLRQTGADPRITLLDGHAEALRGFGKGARGALIARLEENGVQLARGVQPERFGPSSVFLSDGSELASDFTLLVAGARPHRWLSDLGLVHDRGFLTVSETLQTSDPAIFAAGDCADMSFSPRPKAGVFAVRQAPVLLANLRASLSGGRLKSYRPQADYLKLISSGGKEAVADKWGLRLEGPGLWRLKDRIDRKFMDQLADLPKMPQIVLPKERADGLSEAVGDTPLCGGCGAKVGSGDLASALAGLPAPKRPDVVSGPGDDAAILRTGHGFQVMSTDHLRAFTNDPALLSRVAAAHALGDIWAMGASPQVALAQIILPRVSARMQSETLREIMASAAGAFNAVGADVVGGHTSLGAELTIGFTVTGLGDRLVKKGGALPGDLLVLTKPIGTGIILAAEMAKARLPGLLLGEAYAMALRSMEMSSAASAGLLAPYAHAMTDVTGFGLAGHLFEILDASNCAAELDLSSIPVLEGAVALSAAGYASSLAPANKGVSGRMQFTESPLASLLFDPQTAGGLLAAIPNDNAEKVLLGLADAGAKASVIGKLVAGQPTIWVR